MRQEEHNIQVGIVQYLRLRGFEVFAIPNGGRRDAVTGAKLKAEGVSAGVADLIILLPIGNALFVEVKTAKGRQSPEQKAFQERVESLGFNYVIWRSVEDAEKFINAPLSLP